MNQFNSYNNLAVQSSDCYQNLNIPMDYDDFDQDCQKSPTTSSISSTLLNIPTPVLQNVVSTVSLGTRLDLQRIALYARNTEYTPSRFAPVIMRIREPRTTALIFSSGKIVCAGAKSEEISRQASRQYAKIVQSLGFETKFTDFKIHNMVATCDVCFPIQLRGIHNNHKQFSCYEPEIFPGLHYRMVKPKVVIVIFTSGKLNITGAKNLEDIDNAFRQIYPILILFKK